MAVQKKTNKALVIDLKEMEVYKLADKWFKIVIKLINEMQENTDSKLSGQENNAK